MKYLLTSILPEKTQPPKTKLREFDISCEEIPAGDLQRAHFLYQRVVRSPKGLSPLTILYTIGLGTFPPLGNLAVVFLLPHHTTLGTGVWLTLFLIGACLLITNIWNKEQELFRREADYEIWIEKIAEDTFLRDED